MSEPALNVRSLSVSYGAVTAVRDIALEVQHSTCVSMVGANGAGKTSILRAVGGLLRPHRGADIQLDGVSLGGTDASHRARLGLGHVLEGRHVFPDFSVRQNVYLGAVASRRSRGSAELQEACDQALELLPELHPHIDRPAGALSGGQQQMVAIGRALAGRPAVLLMDEPTNGLAPQLVEGVIRIIQAIRSRGISVLLVEQRLEVAERVSDAIHIVQRGRIIQEVQPDDPELAGLVHAAYLG